MYKYVLPVLVQKTAHFIWSCSICPLAPASLRRTLGLVLFHCFLRHCSLVHSHSQTTQASPNLLWNDFSIFFFYACTFQYIAVCTSMHCNVMEQFWCEPAWFGTYQYVLVHTEIYWYVLYLMTQECFANQYLHILVHHTSMYLYILVYTGMYCT